MFSLAKNLVASRTSSRLAPKKLFSNKSNKTPRKVIECRIRSQTSTFAFGGFSREYFSSKTLFYVGSVCISYCVHYYHENDDRLSDDANWSANKKREEFLNIVARYNSLTEEYCVHKYNHNIPFNIYELYWLHLNKPKWKKAYVKNLEWTVDLELFFQRQMNNTFSEILDDLPVLKRLSINAPFQFFITRNQFLKAFPSNLQILEIRTANPSHPFISLIHQGTTSDSNVFEKCSKLRKLKIEAAENYVHTERPVALIKTSSHLKIEEIDININVKIKYDVKYGSSLKILKTPTLFSQQIRSNAETQF
jgi:hypothetical protein